MYSILKVLQNLVGYGRTNAEKKKLEFRFGMSEDMPWKLTGEPEEVLRVGKELLSHAIKNTKSGYICLDAEWKQKADKRGILRICVRDTGIAKEDRQWVDRLLAESGIQMQTMSFGGMTVSYSTEQEIAEPVSLEGQKDSKTVFSDVEKVENLEAFYELRDWANYWILLHELVVVFRGIGATGLCEQARQMELAAKEQNVYYLDRHHPKLIKECRTMQKASGENVFGEKEKPSHDTVPEKKGNILAVDDDTKNICMLKTILADRFEVEGVYSGREALMRLEEHTPEVILLDLHMPDMDGFEVMEQLQQSERTRDIPVIFLTSNRSRSVEARGFKVGAQDFLLKPFVAEVVIQRVARVLELSRLQKNLQQEVETQMIQAEERRKRVENLSRQIVEALVETIEAKDTYTQGHSGRVAEYSVRIAERAGKKKEDLDRIRYMGLLHDIGKIGIPDAIISKNSSLSDKEYFVARKHPEIGAEILEKITEIPDLAVGARYHHERYDGTGYPEGRAEDRIPEEARIIAVADAYDAMASRRSYREVLPQQEVYKEINKGRGTQFDPVYADIMLKLIEEDVNYDMREK